MVAINKLVASCVPCLALLLGASSIQAAIVYNNPDSLYQQNFNGLALSGQGHTWANNSTLSGWYVFVQTPVGNTTTLSTYSASNGTQALSLFSGSLTSYGTLLSSDRALGVTPLPGIGDLHMAVAFRNESSNPLDTFTVTYDGEQWRKGVNANPQSLTFSYGFGNSFTAVSSWVNLPSMTFTSPIFNANAGSGLNGNALANRVAGITDVVTGLDWQTGQTLWLRWTDIDDAGDEHGMGIDNIQFSATTTITAVPEPSSILCVALTSWSGLALSRRRKRRTIAAAGERH